MDSIKNTIKLLAKDVLSELEQEMKKLWFDEVCQMPVEKKQQAKQKYFYDNRY